MFPDLAPAPPLKEGEQSDVELVPPQSAGRELLAVTTAVAEMSVDPIQHVPGEYSPMDGLRLKGARRRVGHGAGVGVECGEHDGDKGRDGGKPKDVVEKVDETKFDEKDGDKKSDAGDDSSSSSGSDSSSSSSSPPMVMSPIDGPLPLGMEMGPAEPMHEVYCDNCNVRTYIPSVSFPRLLGLRPTRWANPNYLLTLTDLRHRVALFFHACFIVSSCLAPTAFISPIPTTRNTLRSNTYNWNDGRKCYRYESCE